MLMLKAAPRRGGAGAFFDWLLPPVSVPRYWSAAAFAACACFAGAVAIISTNSLHQLWGLIAACAYVAAAVGALAWRKRGVDLGLLLSAGGALITPLFLNAASGRKQPEVAVIAKSAQQLAHHHSPYQSAAALATVHSPNAFDPYLPVMILFGIPRAIFGSHVITDPRVWFGLAFLVIFWLALRAAGAQHAGRWTIFVAATPVIAFELAVGGTDVPILALMCLGFALLWRRPRFVLAGIALGLASAAKATAWPAVVVASVLVGMRDGRKPTLLFVGSALASCLVIVGPVAAVWPSALLDNTIKFPLGLASMQSAAASPLPGHVMADTGAAGHLIAIGLLVLAGVGLALSLIIRPPRTIPSAVWRLIIGLTLMFTLAPATRYGYFIYPLALLMWLEISQLGQRRATAEARAAPDAAKPMASSASPA
jgi:4-amino-4-deoxy-L-arabinose transferase-like glycosyltransferase